MKNLGNCGFMGPLIESYWSFEPQRHSFLLIESWSELAIVSSANKQPCESLNWSMNSFWEKRNNAGGVTRNIL